MENSRILNFTTHCWVNCQKFKGASFGCAVLLNFFLLVFKIAVCGVVLLLQSPHLAAHYLLNRPIRGAPNRILYFFLVLACFAIDIPILLIASAIVVGGIECLFIDQILTGLSMGVLGTITGWWCLKCICFIFSRDSIVDKEETTTEEDAESETEEETVEEQPAVQEDPVVEEDDLHFCQLFRLGEEMCLLINHVEMCPDETAFIQVVDDEGYTPIYKRKVKRDKQRRRHIVFNGTNYYLDDKKTQPTVPKK